MPVSQQQHLAPVRKNPRIAIRIVDANVDSQCNATAYGEYSATASAAHNWRRPAQQQREGDRAPAQLALPSDLSASIAMNTTAVAVPRVFCYAVAFRAVEVQKNFEQSRPAMSKKNLRDANALFTASPDFAITRVQEVEDNLLKRARLRTLATRAVKQILGTTCTA